MRWIRHDENNVWGYYGFPDEACNFVYVGDTQVFYLLVLKLYSTLNKSHATDTTTSAYIPNIKESVIPENQILDIPLLL